jgi:hypothetical protein
MIRNPVFDAQAADPAICQIDLDLTTEQPLRPDADNIAYNMRPDHEHPAAKR